MQSTALDNFDQESCGEAPSKYRAQNQLTGAAGQDFGDVSDAHERVRRRELREVGAVVAHAVTLLLQALIPTTLCNR